MDQSVLCLDIGSGTQDVLLYQPGRAVENCPKFVLPSPAQAVARRIRGLTAQGAGVYLVGANMGGGFGRALDAHLRAGHAAAAHPEAALALADDLDRVRDMGVDVREDCPPGHVSVHLADYDPGWWRAFLAAAGLEEPQQVAAAVQDHGFHPGKSNRLGRFDLWRRFLEQAQGRPEALLFDRPPEEMTRLRVLQRAIGGGWVADTGAAAVLGALYVDAVEARSRERGVTVVNLGNSHTIAFLLFQGRILGVYEQHTGVLDRDKLLADLRAFGRGALANEQVLEDRGHGCMTLDAPDGAGDFAPLYVLGPRRAMLGMDDGEQLAPGGDMMLAGCFGLLKGLELRKAYRA